MPRRILAACLLAGAAGGLAPARATAAPFPTRQGEVGLLDVPSADTAGAGGGLIGGELRLDRARGQAATFGPLPLSLVFGMSNRIDGGLAMREGGQPGDATPAPLVFTGTLKARVLDAGGLWPSVAAGLVFDAFNTTRGNAGARLIVSTPEIGRLRLAAFGGAEAHGPKPWSRGATGGLAVSVIHRSDLETVLEATTGPRGAILGGAFRWAVTQKVGVSLGLSYLPSDKAYRLSLGFGLAAAPPRRGRGYEREAKPEVKAAAEVKKAPTGPVFLDDRPRFRMRIASAASAPTEPRHLQYGPYTDGARLSPTARPVQIQAADPAALQGQELAAAAEALDVRERRLRSAEGALATRQGRIAAERERMERRERELLARGQALEVRERQLKVPGKPSARELALAESEEKLRAAEADAAAVEATLRDEAARAPAREREQGAREQQLGTRATEAQAAAGPDATLAVRGRAVEARREHLGVYEGRLAAARDRLEAGEKSLEAQEARLENLERRLGTREERLASVQRRAASRGIPEAPRPEASAPLALVVKPPAAIVKAAPGTAPAAAGAVGKGISAAAVVQLPTPDRALGDRDRDAIESMARVAAKEGSELLVWARAQNPGLMEAAARRAEEIKGVATGTGLSARQVSTRVTLRPSTSGVDVVVSVMREPGAPEAPGLAPAGGLAEGETGRRQLRDAVQAVRADIERCVRPELARRGLDRAEFPLKLELEGSGRVAGVSAGGALAGPEADACLRKAAEAWRFPPSDGPYAAELPISVIGSAP